MNNLISSLNIEIHSRNGYIYEIRLHFRRSFIKGSDRSDDSLLENFEKLSQIGDWGKVKIITK